MPKDDIVKLPPIDRFIGSCPTCGKKVWSTYWSATTNKYICIECRSEIPLDSIVPF